MPSTAYLGARCHGRHQRATSPWRRCRARIHPHREALRMTDDTPDGSRDTASVHVAIRARRGTRVSTGGQGSDPRSPMRTLTKVATLGAAAVLLTVGAAPLLVSGAD